jgi:hypothetical protein
MEFSSPRAEGVRKRERRKKGALAEIREENGLKTRVLLIFRPAV